MYFFNNQRAGDMGRWGGGGIGKHNRYLLSARGPPLSFTFGPPKKEGAYKVTENENT